MYEKTNKLKKQHSWFSSCSYEDPQQNFKKKNLLVEISGGWREHGAAIYNKAPFKML